MRLSFSTVKICLYDYEQMVESSGAKLHLYPGDSISSNSETWSEEVGGEGVPGYVDACNREQIV